MFLVVDLLDVDAVEARRIGSGRILQTHDTSVPNDPREDRAPDWITWTGFELQDVGRPAGG
jgi:hypothetical protein